MIINIYYLKAPFNLATSLLGIYLLKGNAEVPKTIRRRLLYHAYNSNKRKQSEWPSARKCLNRIAVG